MFQILLRNRTTNLNSRMNDGTTPLILAARLAVEGTVEDLINAEAEVNTTDEHGKTALHWAASVNNVEATVTLLQHGANRDAQDHKVSECNCLSTAVLKLKSVDKRMFSCRNFHESNSLAFGLLKLHFTILHVCET